MKAKSIIDVYNITEEDEDFEITTISSEGNEMMCDHEFDSYNLEKRVKKIYIDCGNLIVMVENGVWRK